MSTTREEATKAKAFIDMFVQRSAKAVAFGVSMGMTKLLSHFTMIRWLSVFTIVMVVRWRLAASYAGKKFEARSAPPPGHP